MHTNREILHVLYRSVGRARFSSLQERLCRIVRAVVEFAREVQSLGVIIFTEGLTSAADNSSVSLSALMAPELNSNSLK